MQTGNSISPAAESYRREQERQVVRGELDEALEDTFPASDPVSMTHTTRSGKAPVATNMSMRQALESTVRARPIAAIAIAAGVGFIFGLTR
jgi:ElaB/YqjD/DUF883 family membrane-anchored ribosome-binding protein